MRTAFAIVAAACLLPLVAAAESDETRPDPDEIVKEVRTALRSRNYTAAIRALARAEALRPSYSQEEYEPILKAIAQGVKHKSPNIALVAVKTLGRLKYPNSSRYLSSLVAPPRTVRPERWELHVAAIEVAGTLRDPKSIPKLEQAVQHDNTDFAVAATKALAVFASADLETRVPLARRLGNLLGRLEKKRRPKTDAARVHLSVVKASLLDCLRKVTSDAQLSGADDVRLWVRAAERELKKRK